MDAQVVMEAEIVHTGLMIDKAGEDYIVELHWVYQNRFYSYSRLVSEINLIIEREKFKEDLDLIARRTGKDPGLLGNLKAITYCIRSLDIQYNDFIFLETAYGIRANFKIHKILNWELQDGRWVSYDYPDTPLSREEWARESFIAHMLHT